MVHQQVKTAARSFTYRTLRPPGPYKYTIHVIVMSTPGASVERIFTYSFTQPLFIQGGTKRVLHLLFHGAKARLNHLDQHLNV